MPSSHADDIVGDFFEADDWASLAKEDGDESEEPDLDLPPLPPPRPEAA